MKEETNIARRRKTDKKLARVLPDGREKPLADPGALAQHYESITKAAMERERKLKRAPRVKVMRKALGLTEEAFAAHFHIPLATLRDWEQGKGWEQGRSEPDSCARAYLILILRDPKAVTEALAGYVRPAEDVAHARDTFRSIQNLSRVRDLFWREWDPIGVNQTDCPKDEYDRYADEAYAMLIYEGCSANEIADYLYNISSLGMRLGRPERLKELAAKVASKLVALKPEFEAASEERS